MAAYIVAARRMKNPKRSAVRARLRDVPQLLITRGLRSCQHAPSVAHLATSGAAGLIRARQSGSGAWKTAEKALTI
jgi:hypothetical protein